MSEAVEDRYEIAVSDGDRLLKLNQVIARVKLGKTSIYARVEVGAFPRPVRLGPNCIRWRISEINAWIACLQPRSSVKG